MKQRIRTADSNSLDHVWIYFICIVAMLEKLYIFFKRKACHRISSPFLQANQPLPKAEGSLDTLMPSSPVSTNSSASNMPHLTQILIFRKMHFWERFYQLLTLCFQSFGAVCSPLTPPSFCPGSLFISLFNPHPHLCVVWNISGLQTSCALCCWKREYSASSSDPSCTIRIWDQVQATGSFQTGHFFSRKSGDFCEESGWGGNSSYNIAQSLWKIAIEPVICWLLVQQQKLNLDSCVSNKVGWEDSFIPSKQDQ